MKVSALALAFALVLSGCGEQPGRNYLGKWTRQSTNRHASFDGSEKVDVISDTPTVKRNGDGFMILKNRVFTQGSDRPTTYPEVKEPATFKDGQLQVAGGLGAYAIDQSSGHLVSPEGGGDYTRAK